ncbi:Patatin-like protein 1 [Linum perenne]
MAIPTFDIKKLQPVIFSSYQVEKQPTLDAQLADICISTSAPPTFFPPHYFKNQDSQGNTREFNLIDGAIAANNPTLVAIREVTKEIMKNPGGFSIKPVEYGKFLVVSLGTGSNKTEEKYNAQIASKWGVISWLYYKGSSPLLSCYSDAGSDMVDYHNCVVFKALGSEDNYLRIDVRINLTFNSCLFYPSQVWRTWQVMLVNNTRFIHNFSINNSSYWDATTIHDMADIRVFDQ